ncbi:palmitoyltransferase ZDHHC20-like [Dermacentor silvarum]|uniref:palmitoyltransferase ZDHHC20-like n=1 Tax=Dermacentor silvarum TaxID=543639 RepID=UPI002100F9F5|nr:palmitoyltransferase ZDHHC20-like [Dermacentor silvarum]
MSGITECIDWLPVVGGWLVKAWGYYAYVIVFCGSVVHDDVVRFAFIVGFHVLLALLLWSELATIVTPAPSVPAYFTLSELDLRLLQEARTEEQRKGFLEILGRQRGVLTRGLDGAPDRAHHCSVCRRCVLKMDHHCPWFNNCVCFSTYKAFLLTNLYVILLCTYALFTAGSHFRQVPWNHWRVTGPAVQVATMVLVAVAFTVSVGSFFRFHVTLLTLNRTTLESLRSPLFVDKGDTFDIGCGNNFVEVFGRSRLLWLFPVFTSLGDGSRFNTKLHPHNREHFRPGAV